LAAHGPEGLQPPSDAGVLRAAVPGDRPLAVAEKIAYPIERAAIQVPAT